MSTLSKSASGEYEVHSGGISLIWARSAHIFH
jgi:hypothetical protein